MNKNIFNKKLEICSLEPLTGFNRDGYCTPDKNDMGKHLVCATMDKEFLDFTASKGNDLRSVVKEGENWCLCEDRYHQALKANKAPTVVKQATHFNTKDSVKNKLIEPFSNMNVYNININNCILFLFFILFMFALINSKSGRKVHKIILRNAYRISSIGKRLL